MNPESGNETACVPWDSGKNAGVVGWPGTGAALVIVRSPTVSPFPRSPGAVLGVRSLRLPSAPSRKPAASYPGATTA